MAKITLRPHQKEAIEKALSVSNALFCMAVGRGKTYASLFLARYLLNNKKVDKAIFCVTLSGIGVFKDEFQSVGVDVSSVTTVEELIEFFKSKKKFILVKHSFIEELGKDQNKVDMIEDYLKEDYKKIILVIDEAHKMGNHESWGNFAIDSTRRFYEKIVLLTATPYSSKLEQIFGLVKLIYPTIWKELRDFKALYLEEKPVKDWRTGKFIRMETLAYINLAGLRKQMEPFTFFYYPKINLIYHEHTVKLEPENYAEYKRMCQEIHTELKERPSKGKKKEEED